MDKYNTFIFDSFNFDQDEGRIELRYSLDDEVKFLETIDLPVGMEYQPVSLAIIDRALFALHLIGGTSYFKTCCPPEIEVRSGELPQEQTAFWDRVYLNGLGEFFHQNNIDPTGLIRFPAGQATPLPDMKRPKAGNKVLVPIGGGKDSIVTIEILKRIRRESKSNITLLRMSSHPLITDIVEETGLPCLTVERTLSPLLFELNNQGALNGHVPVTAYISTLSAVIALLYGFDTIVMSNERSADEGNLKTAAGAVINHQWSKGFEFEKIFSVYIKKFIAADLKYFSLLRHLSELSITRYFSSLPQYFTKATSCNVNWKISQEGSDGRWCGTCPKCASSFSLYSAFLPTKTLVEIFGKNLYEDTTLRVLYRELLGVEGTKPFECVGTSGEIKAAFLLAHKRGDLDATPIMQMFLKEVLPKIKNPDQTVKNALKPGPDHIIPKKFLSALNATS